MSAHTPGPWKLDADIDSVVTTDRSVRGDIVCDAPAGGAEESLAFWPANARLIAAAPDLLAACDVALHYLTDVMDEPDAPNQPVSRALAAALAKATGSEAP